MLRLSLLLGTIAALADVAGGLVLVNAKGIQRYLRYFVALGAGFLMATSVLEMLPESLKLDAKLAPVLVMAGYCALHFLEHTIVAHFHFGEGKQSRRPDCADHSPFEDRAGARARRASAGGRGH